jgi:hypothetical protein
MPTAVDDKEYTYTHSIQNTNYSDRQRELLDFGAFYLPHGSWASTGKEILHNLYNITR